MAGDEVVIVAVLTPKEGKGDDVGPFNATPISF